MGSEYFEAFMQQRQATGYQKAQGYDPNVLQKLSDDEVVKATQLLIGDLNNGDLSASRALAIIGGKEAVIALISSIQKYKSPSFQHAEISNALWIITKRQEYQDNLIEDLAITNDIDRSIVVGWLCKTSKSENLISVFWKLIENDRYGIVRSIATEGLLHWNKLIDDSEAINHPYRYLLIDIADDKNISAVNKAKQELVVLLNGL